MQPLASYVMENILWKIAYPAEFHAQTAVECALKLHEVVQGRIDDIAAIEVRTQEPALRIISKKGPLKNPADRDHCLEYIIAVALLKGHLEANDYEDEVGKNTDLDVLRRLMVVIEDPQFTKDYYDLSKRAIPNAIRILFKTGEDTPWVEEHYPIGHPRRRKQGIPLLKQKFSQNIQTYYSQAQANDLADTFLASDWLDLSMDDFYSKFLPNPILIIDNIFQLATN